MWITGHPSYRQLNRFADGALWPREHARVRDHLTECARCQGEVTFIQRTGEVARSLESPTPSADLLRSALARRTTGERVLIPVADVGTPPVRGPLALPATLAALLALLLLGLFLSVRVAQADRPGLRVSPDRPRAGDRLVIEYRAPQLLADAAHLKLRARYRSEGHASWQLLAGVLSRGEDGVFRTELTLPDSVAYAAFAVEDMDGTRLDSHERRLWDVLVHDEWGRPTLAALGARTDDLLGRDWGAAYQNAIRATALYPAEPQAWLQRLAAEEGLFDRDSLHAAYVQRYRGLERSTLDRGPDAEALAWLAGLAASLGDPESAAAVLREAARLPLPAPPVLVRAEIFVAAVAAGDAPALVPQLERIWERHGRLPPEALRMALGTAAAAQDPVALGRWVERYLALGYDWPIATYLAGHLEALDPGLLDRLETHHRALLDPEIEGRRPLRFTVPEYRRRTDATLQRLLTPVAELAAAAGETARATSVAAEAAELAWDTPSLERLGRLLVSAGDTASAVTAFARAAADPLGASPPTALAHRPEWPARLAAAREALDRYVLDASVIRYPDPDARLEAAGRRVPLASLLTGRPLVVVFTSFFSAPALLERQELVGLQARLDSAGTDLLVVELTVQAAAAVVRPRDATADPGPSGPAPRRAAAGRDAQKLATLATDPEGEIQSTFQSSATPNYFILDSGGRIRFEHSTLAEVPRQLDVLRRARAGMAALVD